MIKTCPYCSRQYKRSLYKHLCKSADPRDVLEKNKQEKLIIDLYKNGELYDMQNASRFGIICNQKEIGEIIHRFIPDKEERRQYSSLIRSNAKKQFYKENKFIKTDNYINAIHKIPIKWDKYIDFKNSLNWTFDNFDKSKIKYILHKKESKCQCGETYHANGIFYHFHMKAIHDEWHEEILCNEIKNIIMMFYDLDFLSKRDYMKTFFRSRKIIDNIWKNVFSQEEKNDRKNFMLSQGHLKNKNKKPYVSMYMINFDNVNQFKKIDISKFLASNREDVCPICNKLLDIGLWNHMRLSNDNLHQKILYSQITLVIRNFQFLKFNHFRDLSKQNFLFDYDVAKTIWKKFFGIELFEKRYFCEKEFAMAFSKEYYFQNNRHKTIRGFRKDLGFSTKSSWEANIFRILNYHNCRFNREIPMNVSIDGKKLKYFIDCQDIDGFFGIKNAFIEIKGFLSDSARQKIEAFKRQYQNETLLIIGDSQSYTCDFDYYDIINKYKIDNIYWETLKHNPRTNPEIYLEKYDEIADAIFDIKTKTIKWR